MPSPDFTLKVRPWRRAVTSWADILSHEYKGAGTAEDPCVVTWLPNDPENPQTYGQVYKWSVTMLAATGTLAVGFGSSMLSAAITNLMQSFPGYNEMLYIMITGIFVLGFVVGPLLWAPCSEVFGRRAMFIFTYIPYTAFNAGVCGAKSLNVLLVMRFFAGTFGSSTMTNSGGVIADMFAAKDRGLAMGVFSAMPFLGPAIGPVAGGFLSMKAKWQWVAAVIALFSAVLTFAGWLWLPETYSPVLLRARARKLNAATGKVYLCEQDVRKPLKTKQLFFNQLRVPYILFFTEPIVLFASLYMAVIFAILYMQFTAFPIVFQGYRNWSPGIAALAFVGVTVGAFCALAYIIFYENPRYARGLASMGYLPPEARLPSTILGASLLPVGLFIFAWTCVPTTIHWIGCIIATIPFGAGTVMLFLGMSNYLVDTYLLNAASVLAAGTVVRSILGVVFPLFTFEIYDALGPNWAGTLVAFLSLAFIPCPIIFYYFGQRIRRMTKPGREADDLGHMMAKMMMAQMAGAAGGAVAGAAVGAASAATHAEKTEELNEYGMTRAPASDEEAVLDGRPQLYRATTAATVRSIRSMEELGELEYAPVAFELKSDEGNR
ncbi:MFS general substrate transporter [Cutaneotrichosporon oleaginosum]|uniref:MFS general substrate transporter n=1 Tax=Cutaneotrichosporon oleaginosum TaxID=879819 RepID=A0A0J0XV80_9TREE|nr:MFS general substrate transporter [Cutaneotrichosporon oleaginosum]KLT44968.1 MFS general substrate transporter [Cutaneotrichosporon oleaginosum]TXT09657.1 hypothetical protein COLE_03591 [Cutaneotrichosporon oleaginosum]